MISISLGASIIVLIIHFIGNKRGIQVPDWLKKVLLMKRDSISHSHHKINKSLSLGTICNGYSKMETCINSNLYLFSSSNKNMVTIKCILSLLKRIVHILDSTQRKKTQLREMSNSWKEVARRIDFILYLIHSTIVITAPILIFGKFFLREGQYFDKRDVFSCDIHNINYY